MKLAILSDKSMYQVNDDQKIGNILTNEDGTELTIIKLLPMPEFI
jgi:hypothetical protein